MTTAQGTQAGTGVGTPLIVDLDGTFTLTDTFFEVFVTSLSRAPLATLLSLAKLREDTSYIKQRLASLSPLDPATIPYREDLMAYLKQESAAGREIHLVTAADQSIATAVAAHAGIFKSAVGSTPGLNLKGVRKLAFLKERFPQGFDYIGDSTTDLPIWQDTRIAHIAGDVPKMTKIVKSRDNIQIGRTFADEGGGFRTWTKALRVHQWVKNGLILVPWGLAGVFTARSLLTLIAIFLVFNIVASATYLINDLFDLRFDRQHPTKKMRPLARGELSVGSAFIFVAVALPLSLVLICAISAKAAAFVLCYIALTLLYSFFLKKIAFIDAACLSALFTLRIVIGIAAINVPMSPWLLSFSGLFFLSLGLAKRHTEIRKSLQNTAYKLDGRGYIPEDWPITLSFGVASALSAIVIMMLFIQEEATVIAKYAAPGWLYAIAAFLLLWLMNIWRVSHRCLLDDDPIVFALRDRTSQVIGVAVVVAFIFSHIPW